MLSFHSKVDTFFSNWKELESWVINTIKEEGFVLGDVGVVFMSDEALLEYNVKYLDHNYFTDVITFDEVDHNVLGGDILISVDRVLDNSKVLGNGFTEEFCRVIIHGILHLCGYSDKTEDEKAIMRERENYYLQRRSFT